MPFRFVEQDHHPPQTRQVYIDDARIAEVSYLVYHSLRVVEDEVDAMNGSVLSRRRALPSIHPLSQTRLEEACSVSIVVVLLHARSRDPTRHAQANESLPSRHGCHLTKHGQEILELDRCHQCDQGTEIVRCLELVKRAR